MKLTIPLALLLSSSLVTAAPAPDATAPANHRMAQFLKSKHGFFVHYVWGGSSARPFSIDRNGKRPQTFDAFAEGFDAKGFADDLASWQVDYVILTAWHYNINVLFPSETMKQWGLPTHTCKRDVIRDVIDACKAKNIAVMLYTHPRDGHDLERPKQVLTGWGGPNRTNPKWEKFDKKKWNDFTNDLYAELITRYGKDILGIFSDEGSSAGDSYRVVDYPRLRQTVKSLQPDLVMEQNFYGTTYSLDVGCKEYAFWGEFANRDGNAWPAWRKPVASIFAPSWYATKPAGEKVSAFKPEDMFRYTVLQAGANHEGGGTQWAAGNYIGGGWETGVEETMDRFTELLKPVAASIKGTLASTSYPTAQGTKLPNLKWGVATRTPDDSIEYLHVLTPPANGSNTLEIPVPADGKRFSKAVLLPSQQAVDLKQSDSGVTLKLPSGASWNPIHTVIALNVSPDSPDRNLALWKPFMASSFPDPTRQGGSAWAFAAVDGSDATTWASRPDGETTPGNVPQPTDHQPWCLIDLGANAAIRCVEISGLPGPHAEVQVANDPEFKSAKSIGTPNIQPLQELVIHKASYGAGSKVIDLTKKLSSRVKSGSGEIVANRALAGSDPAPNQVKQLIVEYSLGAEHKSVTIRENESFAFRHSPIWKADLPSGTTGRFLRVVRTSPDSTPMKISEFRVIGSYQ